MSEEWQRKRARLARSLREANAAFGGFDGRIAAMYGRHRFRCAGCKSPAFTKSGRCVECGGTEFREIQE